MPFIDSNTDIRYTADSRIDKAYIFKTVREKCEQIITKKKEPTYVTDVPALGGKVEITGDGIKHGFSDGLKKHKKSVSAEITARAELMLPEILKNSIEVNIKDGRDSETDYSSVLLGVVGIENVNGDTEYYAVRSVVEMGKNKTPALVEYGVVGSLYAANAKKTADIDHDWFDDNTSPRPVRRLRRVSISQLLDSVKGVFDDTLSNDVYEHFGVKRRESDFSKELRFAVSGKATSGELLPSVRDELSDKLSELSVELKVEKGNVRAFKKDVLDITEQIANDGVVSEEAAEALARVLYEYSTEEAGVDEYEERLRDAASRINRTRLYVSPQVRADIADYNDFARHFGVGKLTSDENNISVDRFFSELAEDFPELGLDKSLVLGDKLHALKDIKDRAREISARSNIPLSEIMDFNSVRDDFISLAREVLDEARELSGYALPMQSDIDAARKEESELRKSSPVVRSVERNAGDDILSTAKTEKEFGEDAEALLSYIEKSYKKDSPEYALAKAITELEKDKRYVGKKIKSVIDAFKIKAFKADRAKVEGFVKRLAENLGFSHKLRDIASLNDTLFSFYEMMEDFIAGKTSSEDIISAARAIAEGVVGIRGESEFSEIERNCGTLVNMASVASLTGNELSGDLPLRDKIKKLFDSFGNNVHTDKFGDVALTNSSIRSDLRHGSTREKIAAYAAIPEVLQNGVVIESKKKNNGEVDRTVVAAPISIGGISYYMGVMLQRDANANRLYIHDVILKKEAFDYHTEHLNTTGPDDSENLFLTEVLEKAVSVGYSIAQKGEIVKGKGKIIPGMSDAERQRILNGKEIVIQHYDAERLSQFRNAEGEVDLEALKAANKDKAESILRKIAKKFGIYKEYYNPDIDISFSFSGGRLHESVRKQSGNYDTLAELMTIFDSVIENAVALEVHTERYGNPDSNVDSIYTLVGAFENDSGIIPVRLTVKTFTDGNNPTLHVVVAQSPIAENIKKENRSHGIDASPNESGNTYARPVPYISIADLFENVNTSDGDLLKYAPDGFLSDGQKKSKSEALKKETAYIKEKNSKRYGNNTSSALAENLAAKLISGIRSVDAAARFLVKYGDSTYTSKELSEQLYPIFIPTPKKLDKQPYTMYNIVKNVLGGIFDVVCLLRLVLRRICFYSCAVLAVFLL